MYKNYKEKYLHNKKLYLQQLGSTGFADFTDQNKIFGITM